MNKISLTFLGFVFIQNAELLPPLKEYDFFDDELPVRCDQSFDAASVIDGDLYMFKWDYFWKPSENDDSVKIQSKWKELPMPPIDAVFENEDKIVWFFIKASVYVFNNTTFLQKLSLQDFGIDQRKYSKIDAIFRWPHNNNVYIFSGEDYWLLEGSTVKGDYPKKILQSWHDVYDADTVFSKDDKLIILKDEYFYEFDTRCMNINRMVRTRIGPTFLNCPEHTKKVQKGFDVIRFAPASMCLDDVENIEKLRSEPENPSTKGSSNVIATLPVSLTTVIPTFVIVISVIN